MNKKILIINGSFRKKNTYSLLLQTEKILNVRGFETEIINLFDYNIGDCMGCEACVTGTGCNQNDDMVILMKKIMDSDGVVLSSPIYLNSVSSRFKTFSDRTNKWMHKPEPAGKPVLFVASTTFTGIKETNKFFRSYAVGFGARIGDFISRVEKKFEEPVQEKEMAKFLSLLEEDTKYYRPAMDEIIMFTVQKVLALKSTKEDRKYWEEKGWLDKRYYFPCKMSPGKMLFSKFIFKAISGAMK
jgi:multimeric flavodoxin WrbA